MGVSLAPAATQSLPAAERRASLATAVRQAGLAAFSGAIVLSPFRARIVLEARPQPPVFGDYTNLLLFWNEILILAVFGIWGLSLLLQPRRLDLGPVLIRLPVLGLLAAAWLAAPFSQDPGLALFNAVTLLGLAALGLYAVNEIRDLSQIMPAVAAMIVLQSAVAIPQVVTQQSFGLHGLGELRLDPAVPGTSILWTEHAPRLLRGYGLTDHPNILGGLLALALLVLAAGLAKYREDTLAVLCGVFGLGVAGLLVTFSRSAALALAAGLAAGLALLCVRRDWRSLRLWLAAGLVGAIIAVPLVKAYSPYLGARVNPTAQAQGSTEARALSEREALTRATNDVFVAHPLTGVGAGVLPGALRKAFPDFAYNYAPAHVAILVVAAETGIAGALAYGLLMLAPWLLLWLRRDRLTPELIGVSCAFLALQIIGLFDYYTWSLDQGRIWFWLVLGLWVVAYRGAAGRTVSDA